MEPLSGFFCFMSVESTSSLKPFVLVGWLACFCISFLVHSVLHEMAHFLVCRRFGNTPQVVGFGILPVRLSRTIFLCPFFTGFNGNLDGSAPLIPHNTGQLLFLSSGFTVTTIISILAMFVAKEMSAANFTKFALAMFAATGMLILPENLFSPYSDGLRIWRTLAGKNCKASCVGTPYKVTLRKHFSYFLYALLFIFLAIVGIFLALITILFIYA